ncbi:MAG: thiamine ABC transporter substrate-binding protein [Actinomycetaceae bacterium]|nr:thiamine ABC transporter substrate-binding protein [Actinomycetaceae bacterium]
MFHASVKPGARIFAACGAILLGLTACSGTSSEGDAETVTVLTHDSFELPEAAIQKFEKDTGFKLKTVSAGDAGVANQLALGKNSTKYDAAYGIDTYSAGQAQKAGVLQAYDSPAAPESAKDYAKDGLTPVDLGEVCVNVDHEWFSSRGMDEPKTLDDLAKPEYAKLLVIPDPASSATGFAFLAGIDVVKGDESTSYLTSLLGGGTKVAAGWSEAYYTDFSGEEGKGEFPLVLSYSSSPAETGGKTGVIESTCIRQVEYAAVIKGAKNEAGAKAFVDFMLSADVQAEIPESMYMYPIDSTAPLPKEWAEHAKLAENPIEPDADVVSDKREDWLDAWTEIRESAA